MAFRKPTQFERKYLKDQLRNMLTCQMSKLTVEQLASWTMGKSQNAFVSYLRCFHNKNLPKAVRACQKRFRAKCTKFPYESLQNGCHKLLMAAHGEVSFNEVPTEHHKSVKEYIKCTASIYRKIKHCVPILEKECRKRQYKAIKLLRADMDFVEDLLDDWADVKVVYSTRDPRGILTSRREDHRLFSRSLVREAPFLCKKMERDLETFKMLKEKYPSKFFRTSYEELAKNPLKMTKKVYKFLGIPLSQKVQDLMYSMTHAKKDQGAFNTVRSNATATSMAWRRKLKQSEKIKIDKACKNVYKNFKYVR